MIQALWQMDVGPDMTVPFRFTFHVIVWILNHYLCYLAIVTERFNTMIDLDKVFK